MAASYSNETESNWEAIDPVHSERNLHTLWSECKINRRKTDGRGSGYRLMHCGLKWYGIVINWGCIDHDVIGWQTAVREAHGLESFVQRLTNGYGNIFEYFFWSYDCVIVVVVNVNMYYKCLSLEICHIYSSVFLIKEQ